MTAVEAAPPIGLIAPQARRRSGWRALLREGLRARGAAFGLTVTLAVAVLALGADLFSPHNPNVQDYNSILAPPEAPYWLGTDELGRDLLSRTIHGSRVALEAGLVSVGLAAVAGTLIGLLAGYVGGYVDALLMRVTDALWSFPGLVLALAVGAVLGPGLFNAMLAVGLVFTPIFARLVRAQVLSVREREFVLAARMLGANGPRIMARHILPNVATPIIVQASVLVAFAIIVEASLSFLGLGVQPPTPSWGNMLSDAQSYVFTAPLLAMWPGLAILLTVLAFNFLGESLRDALDPRG